MLVLVPMVLTDSVPMDLLDTTSSANVKLKLMLIQLISIMDTMVMPDTAMPDSELMVPMDSVPTDSVPMVLTHTPLPTVAWDWLVWLLPHLTQPTPLPSIPPVSVSASTTLAHKF